MRAKPRRATALGPSSVCLVDGHNVILGVTELARLQHGDRGEEARERLAEACLRLALRRRVRVILFFDGAPDVRAPAPRSNASLEIVYATGAGGADARILNRATRLAQERRSVLAVSDDRALLASLPK